MGSGGLHEKFIEKCMQIRYAKVDLADRASTDNHLIRSRIE